MHPRGKPSPVWQTESTPSTTCEKGQGNLDSIVGGKVTLPEGPIPMSPVPEGLSSPGVPGTQVLGGDGPVHIATHAHCLSPCLSPPPPACPQMGSQEAR